MLKSTHRTRLLPPGWTEHKAPTGQIYYYNDETKESTYKHPGAAVLLANPSASYLQHQAVPQINLLDPATANAFMAQYRQRATNDSSGNGFAENEGGGFRNRSRSRPRPRAQPIDKPKSKSSIPGCEPWILVYTKYRRRFAYNPTKNASFWRIPDKLKAGILELDQARIRQKANVRFDGGQNKGEIDVGSGEADVAEASVDLVDVKKAMENEHDHHSSEYEEVEVTDNEDSGAGKEGNTLKRQHMDGLDVTNGPVEFTEADIAAQLRAMDQEYDMEAAEEHDHADGERWDEQGGDEFPLSQQDARDLFKDMLNDFNTNPYSPWESLLEQGKIIDDARYTVLHTTKERKEVWEEWSRTKISELNERRAHEEKRDPRILYMAFLQEHATPKLYWPEFRRKYRKEEPMRGNELGDKDREKWYREHITRLKMPQATLKADLRKLLDVQPLSLLNNRTFISNLPVTVLRDLRYISLDPKIREPFIEAYIQDLKPPPEDGERVDQDDAVTRAQEERRRRERALQERERATTMEGKRRQERQLEWSKTRLREKEQELKQAMQAGGRGLQSQLAKRDS